MKKKKHFAPQFEVVNLEDANAVFFVASGFNGKGPATPTQPANQPLKHHDTFVPSWNATEGEDGGDVLFD